MADFGDIYRSKLRSADEIAAMIPSGAICVAPSCVAQPTAIPAAIADRARRGLIEGVVHHSIFAIPPAPFTDPELHGRYDHVSWFTQAAARKSVQAGLSDYMPCNYHELVDLWDHRKLPDVFYSIVTPMDRHGWFSFGLVGSECEEMLHRAKMVFLEVNPNMPRVYGRNIIHISEVTAVCEHKAPIMTVEPPEITEKDLTIGRMIADYVRDGATIQFGIGGVPGAVGKCLSDKKDLGIHTELFTESMIDLIESGVVTNRRKSVHNGKTIAAFALGTQRMYDFLDDNMSIEMMPVDVVNDPLVIGKMKDFVSVNACLEVDLLGQVCSESIGSTHFSGSGGQADFVRGCNISPGGQSFIAMYSTAKNDTISKIKPTLTPGAVVTTNKNDVDYIVTEHGIVRLRGKTAGERARALISIAHPKFRDELTFEARKLNLIV